MRPDVQTIRVDSDDVKILTRVCYQYILGANRTEAFCFPFWPGGYLARGWHSGSSSTLEYGDAGGE